MSDNEENCDYTLNQILHAALLSRGYTVREEEGKLLPAFKIPVAFDTLAYINSRNNGSTVTRLDVETRLPDGSLLYEAYGDIGGSIEEALSANWDNFEKSGLNVMLDAYN